MYPAVAFDGTNYLVVWQDCRNGVSDIYAARVSTDGSLLDSGGLSISRATDRQERPAVAFNGTRYLVAWQDRRNGGFDIYGARVATSGSVFEPGGLLISDALRDQARPAVASDGQSFFAVWEDARNVYDDIYGARIGSGGMVFDTLGIAIAGASLAQEHPDIVYDGDRYAVAWQDKRTNVDYDIYMSRVDTDGLVLDPAGILVSGAAGDQEEPAIAYNNRGYVLLWQDGRGPEGFDIYGARADTSGTVADPDGFEVSGAAYNQVAPDLCSDPVGVILMTYSSFIPDPGFGSFRIWANFFDLVAGAPGGPAGPGLTRLYPNSPNPFRGSTTLRFGLAQRAEVALKVYDVEGRLVETLVDGVQGAGFHNVTWEGRSAGGRVLAPGLYFLSFKAGAYRQTQKMLLLR
jgi:hypothetical protein